MFAFWPRCAKQPQLVTLHRSRCPKDSRWTADGSPIVVELPHPG